MLLHRMFVPQKAGLKWFLEMEVDTNLVLDEDTDGETIEQCLPLRIFVRQNAGFKWRQNAGLKWRQSAGLKWRHNAGLKWRHNAGLKWRQNAGLKI